MSEEKANGFWAVVEMMGHVRIAGYVTEETRFGAALGRVDIPQPVNPCQACDSTGKVLPLGEGSTCPECGGTGKLGGGMLTQFFSGASLFRMTPCSEEVAREVAARCVTAPVSAFEMPRRIAASVRDDGDDWEEDGR